MGGSLKAKRVKKGDKGREGKDWGNYINAHIHTGIRSYFMIGWYPIDLSGEPLAAAHPWATSGELFAG